ncbi:MAG: phenylalanine--tRNA ligase subunit beta [Parachlamydiales bacterium]|nr:phenylalanine--tRNA ligase subunit beta [Parachlamydiales bacterium]
MKITYSLLKEFLQIDEEPKDIAHLLTMAGIEVDNIENEKPSFTSVISALVEDTKKHPDADTLTVATVFDGAERHQVVCGAHNCKKGLITAFARVGSTLIDEDGKVFKIKKAKLRGVESFGMLCSAKELRLSQEALGILELNENIEIGKNLEYLADPIFEISLTPNLGHLLSAIGLARDLAAVMDKKIKIPSFKLSEETKKTDNLLDVSIEDARSDRYIARVIKNIKVAPSPFWLKNRLEACGFRSVNNIVDSVNYAMLLFGHPMHAFDMDKIEGNKLIVTNEKNETTFTCLDESERVIPTGSLVIKDMKKTVAIAGIMGGLNTSVNESTKNIILEAAHFDPISIRKTSKLLNLKTESSMRFEKGIDFEMIPFAIDYAAHLINELSKESINSCKIDKIAKKQELKTISLRVKKAQKIIGNIISLNEIINIFERLEFKIVKKSAEDEVLIEVPSYRNDISLEIDLIEEIARIYGYNNLQKKPPLYRSSSITHSEAYFFEQRVKSYLRSCSMQEIITCDLVSPKLIQTAKLLNLDKDAPIEVKYFKSIDQSVLRPTLLPSFLETIKYNLDHNNFNLPIFELSKVHLKNDDKYVERNSLAIALSGKRTLHLWDKSNFDVNFYDLKGILENVISAITDKKYLFKKSTLSAFHPGRQANIFIDEIDVGIIGEIHPKVLQEYDIKKRVYFSELNLSYLMKNKKEDIKFKNLPSYPGSERDLTITLKEDFEIQNILNIIEKLKINLLEKVYILDLFKSTEDKKNVTLRFFYRDQNKTISNEEVEIEHLKITQEITKHLEK